MFKTSDNVPFLAKIVGVSETGQLQLTLENEEIKVFEIKEPIKGYLMDSDEES